MRIPRGPRPFAIQLTDRQRAILEEMIHSRRRPHDEVQRATLIVQSADGARTRHLAAAVGVSDPTVRLWRARWAHATPQLAAAEAEADEETMRGLLQQVLRDAPRRGRPATFTPEQRCQIVAVACEAPEVSGRPVTPWPPRELAEAVIKRGIVSRISPRSVGRFLKEADLTPHPSRYWLHHDRAENPQPCDADVQTSCELYQQAPQLQAQGVHVVSTDEKTGMQAHERAHPTRPMQPGRGERVECEYIRHGPQTLIANFEVATGQGVAPSVGPTRTEEDFLGHIERTIARAPAAAWIFIVDRLNTPPSESLVRLVATQCGMAEDVGVKGKSGILASMPARADFLQDPTPRIRFAYTPTHTSWLNQVEIWFSILARRLLKRGSFTSVDELRQRLLAFITSFNQTMAKPFTWTYAGRPLTAYPLAAYTRKELAPMCTSAPPSTSAARAVPQG